MIKPQRKTHYYIWLLLAFLLPAGIIGGWIAVPVTVRDYLLQPEKTVSLPVTQSTIVKPGYTIRLNSDQSKKNWQLEWTNQEALTVPSALVYQATDAGSTVEMSTLLGRVGERGIFHFRVAAPGTDERFHFIFYDIIHHRILDRIDIKP